MEQKPIRLMDRYIYAKENALKNPEEYEKVINEVMFVMDMLEKGYVPVPENLSK